MAGKTNAELQAELEVANAEIKRLSEQPAASQILNNKLDSANNEIAKLNNELAVANELKADLQSKLADGEKLNYDLTEKLTQKDQELSDAQGIIEEQHKALSAQESLSDDVIVTVDKKRYKVVMPVFNVGGVNYKAVDLKENKELAAKLVLKGSGVLQLLS